MARVLDDLDLVGGQYGLRGTFQLNSALQRGELFLPGLRCHVGHLLRLLINGLGKIAMQGRSAG
jgi:hypothetical protein